MKVKTSSMFSAACLMAALFFSAGSRLQAAVPSNDNFAAATPITGASGSIAGSDVTATAELNEPVHAEQGGQSIWYRWTAPATGAAIFDTAGTSFDSILAVYTGQSVGALTLVAQNDDDLDNSEVTSRVVFPVTAGTVYRIAVVGQEVDAGDSVLNWQMVQSLIRFAQPKYVIDENNPTLTRVIQLERIGNISASASVIFRTQDSNEANAAGSDTDYVPTPEEGLTVNFNAGSSVGNASFTVVSDPDIEGDEVVQLVLSDASAGAVVAMENSAVLVIRDDDDNPANDLLANAADLSTVAANPGTTEGSGTEEGEPAHAGVSDGHSIWYKFTAPANGTLLLDTSSGIDDLDTVLAVYTGPAASPAFNTLTPVASNDNGSPEELLSRLSVAVTNGTTYYIALDTKDEEALTDLNASFATGGTVQLSATAYSAVEDEGFVTITVTRTGGLDAPLSVICTTSDNGSALAGTDYTAVNSPVSFAVNEATKTFTVPISNDIVDEGDETFLVSLSSPSLGAILGSITQATVTIDDDEDNPPNDFFAAAQLISGYAGDLSTSNFGARREAGEPVHAGAGKHSIWFKWRAPAAGVVSFDTAGSIDQNGDPLDTLMAAYTGDALSNLVQVSANNNNGASPNARLNFVVKAGVNYYIAVDGAGDSQGDIAFVWGFGQGGLIQFGQARYEVNEGDLSGVDPVITTATITVNRTEGLTGEVTVDYAIEDGTATDGSDYNSTFDTLTFAAGQASKTITVEIRGDTISEGDETVLVTLSNAQGGAAVGDLSQATLVINDNDDDPANDNFLAPQTLNGSTGVVTSVNSGASRQTGEPLHAGVSGHRSIWFTWTAPVSGIAAFDTAGSLGAVSGPLDTLLAVYTGSSLGALVSVASNNDAAPGTVTSRVAFSAKAGTAYRIAVDAAGDVGGDVTLAWTLGAGGLIQFHQPSYAAREKDDSVTITVDRVGSTASGVSVKYETAGGTATSGVDFTPTSGTLNIPATQSSASFTIPLAKTDGKEGEENFTVTLKEPAGGAVLIGDSVTATVTVEDSDDDPANDEFAAAIALGSDSGTTSRDDMAGASFQPGEPTATAPGRHTIWYTWTPAAGGNAIFDTIGSGNFATVLTAFTGTTLGNLQVVASSDSTTRADHTSRITFAAIAGRTYYIAIDARAPISGPVVLNWGLATGGTFAFAAASWHVEEKGGPTLIVTVNRTDSNSNSASVVLTTVDGTAKAADGDFNAVTATLKFAAGQITRSVAIKINDDVLLENDETFTVALDNPSPGAVVGGLSVATVTIRDDEDDEAGDHFDAPLTLAETEGSADPANNIPAGRDAGEKLPGLLGQVGSGRTVWYEWTAPAVGDYTFSTVGSEDTDGNPLDTVLGIFTGTTLSQLKLVAENDEDPDNSPSSTVTFKARAGRKYFIAVDSTDDTGGTIQLAWTFTPPDGDGPLLTPLGKVRPTISFTETYSDVAESDHNGGFDLIGTKGGFSVKIVTPLTDRVDVTGLTAATSVSLLIGDLELTSTLGGADQWSPGQTSATFTVDTGVFVTFSWTPAALTITATGDNPDVLRIATYLYAGFPLEKGNTLDVDIEFAGTKGARILYLSGSSTSNAKSYADTVKLTGKPDYTPPKAAFSLPAANAPVTGETVSFFGTAGDDKGISNADYPIQLSINGGELQDPDIYYRLVGADEIEDPKSAKWELLDVPLEPGLNTVVLYVTDDSGNVTTATRVVNRATKSPLNIVIEGQGTVTGAVPGADIELGKPVTLTAKPADGWLFKEWAGGISATTPKITFKQQDGLSVTARFVANPFLAVQGNYSGLVQAGIFAPGETGTVQVALGALGTFTGKVTIGGKTYSLPAGVSFNNTGDAVIVIPRKAPLSPLTVTLHLDVSGESGQITGSVSDGSFTSAVVADHAVFSATNPAPQKGYYTVLLPSVLPLASENPVAGHGYCKATVTPAGVVMLVGNTADDGKISLSAPLSSSGVLSIYQTFKGGRVLAGSAIFATSPTTKVTGDLTWYRSPSSTLEISVIGEPYVKPAKGTPVLGFPNNGAAFTRVAGAGYAGTPLPHGVTLTADNVFVVAPEETGVASLKVDVASGLLSGTVKDPQGNGKTFKLKGVVLQTSVLGAGYFVNGTQSGTVTLSNP